MEEGQENRMCVRRENGRTDKSRKHERGCNASTIRCF